MQIEESSNQYRPFLRSGSYPSVAALLQRRSEWLRVAGLVAIAGAASGAGYATTLWLVPSIPSTSLAFEQVHNVLPAAAANGPQPTREENVELPRNLASNVVVGPSENAKRESVQPARPTQSLAEADSARKGKPRAHLEKEKATAPVALDDANWDSFRTELIAERVRAFDEAQATRHVSAQPSRAAQPRVDVEPEQAGAPQLMAAGEPQDQRSNAVPAWSAATPLATSRPGQQGTAQGRLNVWPLMAAVSVDSLNVRGGLAASSVKRALERLKPSFVSCYGQAAQQAGRNRFGRVQVTVTIDETGRVRAPRVHGGGLPGLDDCMTGVTGKLVTEAPDTGTVAASLVVNFTP